MLARSVRTTQPTVKLGASLFLAACGITVLIHTHPEQLRAPEWVAVVAVGLFGFAGICIATQALRLNRLVRWLVCGLLGAMSVVPAWIAFGPGPRQCTMMSLGAHSAVSEVTCRGAFGAGALVLALMFVIAVRGALRARRAG